MNGAGIIHDFEIALSGATSEDVDEALGPGRFGMAEETGRLLNDIICRPRAPAGDWTGRRRLSGGPAAAVRRPKPDGSRVAARHPGDRPCGRRHRHHPHAPGGIGGGHWRCEPTRFPVPQTSAVARLEDGVYLNCGSAVVLPEVFLKAIAIVRNQGIGLDAADYGQYRLPPHVPAPDQRCRPPGCRHSGRRHLARRPPRSPDSIDRGRTAGRNVGQKDASPIFVRSALLKRFQSLCHQRFRRVHELQGQARRECSNP